MDLAVENLRYIESHVGVGVYHDNTQTVYVLPYNAVSYRRVFEGLLESFDAFYTYATTFSRQPKNQELVPVVAYLRLKIKNAPMEDFIKGFRRAQVLAQSNEKSRVFELLDRVDAFFGSRKAFSEQSVDALFLESGMYLSTLSLSTFYRANYLIGRYYFKKGFLRLGRRFAIDAFEMSGKTSSVEGTLLSKGLIDQIDALLVDEFEGFEEASEQPGA
ncbi:hypothetical protein NEDG_00134 [Nematocida displodere]|uniref:Uncharacterized protein n=1 Tax=Nematocida displodere TaxID=1805483 RepID=A0A177EL00_9MICR|nr:hypothetical protein NEDG_00134 [Nematocida displodere]